jgi:formyl-CoA transferase
MEEVFMKTSLNGIRVLDVTQVMAGPFCAMLLCDMGADVIKVEAPYGDSSRRMAGGSGNDSAAFNAVNRGKRGIVVDLKTKSGAGILRHLSESADVLIENYRPGVMSKLGLGYDQLKEINPQLIYASISGYGQTGPAAEKGGFDLVAQGVSGLMSVTGEPGRAPIKAGIPVTDLGAGLFAVCGILAALQYRERTGRGQQIDAALVDAGLALSVWETTELFSRGTVPGPLGSAHRMSAPYQAIRCADGYITLGAANDRLFGRLATLLGHPEWCDDPRFSSDGQRVGNRTALAEEIESVTSRESRSHWLEALEAQDIPCGPINNYEEAINDPHIQARDMVVETDHPTLGRIKTLGTPIKMSETPLTPGRPAPLLGEHTEDVLLEAGYSQDAVTAFRDDGVIR